MRLWPLTLAIVVGTIPCSLLSGQGTLSLEELARLARQRFEAERPQQLQALQPFLKDLELPYDSHNNREYLDGRFEKAAQLGDSIVPLLLEKLTPQQEGDPAARTVAANSARVLSRIDPSGFVDALVDIANGQNYTGRGHAIELLGESGSAAAAAAIERLLDHLDGDQLVVAVHALRQLGTASSRVLDYLGSRDERLRREVLELITEEKDASVLGRVLQALSVETASTLYPLYVGYLDEAAPRSADAAKALLELITKNRLDQDDTIRAVHALGHVAPQGHRATLKECDALLGKDTGELARTCALTMLALGDKTGVNTLLENLHDAMSRDRHDADPYIERGELSMAMKRWTQASHDFQEATRMTNSPKTKELLNLRIAVCESELKNWSSALQALKDSNASYATIQREAGQHPALNHLLEQTAGRLWLQSLPGAGS